MSSCPHHPVRLHHCVHEVGHAAAAIERGIPLESVVVYRTAAAFGGALAGERANGSATIESALRAALAGGAVSRGDMFHFAMAAMAAEQAVLGDRLAGGGKADVRLLSGWLRRPLASDDDYNAVLGHSSDAGFARTIQWCRERTPSLMRAAMMLAERDRLSLPELADVLSQDA